MSRVAKNPITLPKGVSVKLDGNSLSVKGAKGEMVRQLHPLVSVAIEGDVITVQSDRNNKTVDALAGTTRANINNMVVGVSAGYERKLTLVGVGYRAAVKGDILSLSLGFSHPVDFQAPTGITLETPTQTEIVVKGYDKQVVGQVSANIRAYRPPEPYKGKGIRYSDEVIIRKEAKKK